MNYKVEIDGHTFEFRYSSTGSLDPWSGDYAHENNINLNVIRRKNHESKNN